MSSEHENPSLHLGPIKSVGINGEGVHEIAHEIHGSDDMNPQEMKAALVEKYGLDPETTRVEMPHTRRSTGGATVSFSGAWEGSKWEPEGPAPNFGYTPDMN